MNGVQTYTFLTEQRITKFYEWSPKDEVKIFTRFRKWGYIKDFRRIGIHLFRIEGSPVAKRGILCR